MWPGPEAFPTAILADATKPPKKEESSEPDLYDTGYYDIYGDEDSNLNGEC